MAVDLNNSPTLTMEEITKQLFNNKFMSDIQFRVAGKVLYAHSWELMKRSIVFREQFKGNLGENKLIPVEDTTYKAFHEFLRFIYTDEFDTVEAIRCEILKLAVRYKIVRLENILVNMECEPETHLKLFEYSVVNDYKLIKNSFLEYIIDDLDLFLKMDIFFDINLEVVEEILKSNKMTPGITEVKLFNVLVRWMDRSCAKNNIPLTERRLYFDNLLQLIRFPVMTPDEFRLCTQNHPNLLTTNDISTICQKIVLGPDNKKQKWNANPRLDYENPAESGECDIAGDLSTKFTVSKNLILSGLIYGLGYTVCEILIYAKHRATNFTEVFSFKFLENCNLECMSTFSLGESIKLKPDIDYTIVCTQSNSSDFVICKPHVQCIIIGPSESITFTKIAANLFEIFVKLPTD